MARCDVKYVMTVDAVVTHEINAIARHLIQLPDLEFHTVWEIEVAFLHALFEYWVFGEWAELEFFLECCRQSNIEILQMKDNLLIQRLADRSPRHYPRLARSLADLNEQVGLTSGEFYIKDQDMDAVFYTMMVLFGYDVY